MAQPTASIPRIFKGPLTLNNLTTAGAVYYGAALSDASGAGTVNQLVDDEAFVGFALQDQTTTGGNVQIATSGVIRLTVTGANALTDYGTAVYCTEGNTFSMTDSGSDTQIGTFLRLENATATTCDVAFEAAALRSV